MKSAATLINEEFEGIMLPEPYGKFLGPVDTKRCILIWGPKYQGKTTYTLDLSDVMASEMGKVIFYSGEEGVGISIQNKLKRLKLDNPNMLIGEFHSLDKMKKELKKEKPKVAVLDSLFSINHSPKEFHDLREWCKHKGIVLVVIAHANKDGSFKGNSSIPHMADTEIYVNEGKAEWIKNRFGDEQHKVMEINFERENRNNPVSKDDLKGRQSKAYEIGVKLFESGNEFKPAAQNREVMSLLDDISVGEGGLKILKAYNRGYHNSLMKKANETIDTLKEQSRENPESISIDPVLLEGLEYIENPGPELRENKAVSPDEIYQRITDMIIKTIEEDGELPFESAWRKTGLGSGRVATNFVSQNPYRGINFWMLNFEQKDGKLKPRKLANPYFMTFNQVDEAGGKVKKGAEAEMVIYFTQLYKHEWVDDNEENRDYGTYSRSKFITWVKNNRDAFEGVNGNLLDMFSPEQIANQSLVPILRYYNVFNAKHIEGIDWGKIPQNEAVRLSDDKRIALAQRIYDFYPGNPEVVQEDSDRAFYRRSDDIINMPPFSSFKNEQYYYSVLYHEAIHSTGAPNRLDREFGKTKSDPKYWFEELVAELGAAYLCGEAGILFRTIENTAAYLDSYRQALLEKMKDDNKFFFRAASRAQAGADYILDRNEAGIPAYRQDFDIHDLTGEVPDKKEISKSKKKAKKEFEGLVGDNTTVDFKADGSIQQDGEFAIFEIEDVIPSHNKDCSKNSKHKISKGQPRDRSLDALCSQPKFIAQNLNPKSITEGNLAFNGAPSIIPDGQVIQGNGRSIALKIAYDEHKKKAKAYRQYLIDNAEKWGFDAKEVKQAKRPALVRMLDVSDDKAIELGNVVDTSQAKMSAIDEAKAYVRNLSKQKRQIIGDLINDSNGETITEVINDKGLQIFDQIKTLDRQELVKDGELTSNGKELLRSMFAGLVFDSEENKDALTHFLNLKHTQKAGIERSYGHIIPFIGTDADITPKLQKAVEIISKINSSSGIETVGDFMSASDAFEGSNADKFSNDEAALADFIMNQTTQKGIRDAFRMYQWKINGRADMFDPIQKTDPETAFMDSFVEMVRVNPSERQVKLQSVSEFDTGEVIRDFYDTDKYEIVKTGKDEFVIKNVRTGKKENIAPDVKRFVPDRGETPTMDIFRKNKADDFVYIWHGEDGKEKYTAESLVDAINTLTHYDREDEGIPEITTVSEAIEYIETALNEKVEVVAKQSPVYANYRKNGKEDQLIYLGIVDKVDVNIPNQDKVKGVEGSFIMCSNMGKDQLYIIPTSLAKTVNGKIKSKKADKLFKEFHWYEADNIDFEIDWPEGAKPKKVGTAEKIFYASDKIMRPEDQKGSINFYKHDFDAGKRPVKVLDNILIIEKIKWDTRGILN